jgi:hypothetical protein
MKPFAVKIWIGECCAFHASVLGERTTIVPSCVFPLPAYRRSRRPLGAVDAAFVGLGVEPLGAGVVLAVVGIFPAAVLVVWTVWVVELGLFVVGFAVCAPPDVTTTVSVVPAAELPPPPQPASSAIANRATSAPPMRPASLWRAKEAEIIEPAERSSDGTQGIDTEATDAAISPGEPTESTGS